MNHAQIFVNLPIKDVARSRAFFASLGYTFNEQFSNDQAFCMVAGENLFVMMLVEPFFQTFTKKPITDAFKGTEVLTCLSCSSRAEIDELVAKAVAAGGKVTMPPQDHGFMYGHGYEDLDGHQWEFSYMDMSALPAQP